MPTVFGYTRHDGFRGQIRRVPRCQKAADHSETLSISVLFVPSSISFDSFRCRKAVINCILLLLLFPLISEVNHYFSLFCPFLDFFFFFFLEKNSIFKFYYIIIYIFYDKLMMIYLMFFNIRYIF